MGGLGLGRVVRCGRAVVVHDDAVPWAFEVVKLAASGRPQYDPGDDANEDEAQGNEQDEDVQCRARGQALGVREAGRGWGVSVGAGDGLDLKSVRRSAFSTTSSELADMPMPAIHGVT